MDLTQVLRDRNTFLTTSEVMELLRCRRNTLCDWVRDGRIPAARVGNSYLFDPGRIADWIDQRTTGMSRDRKAS
jgi:excisionase family DNA binding protein